MEWEVRLALARLEVSDNRAQFPSRRDFNDRP